MPVSKKYRNCSQHCPEAPRGEQSADKALLQKAAQPPLEKAEKLCQFPPCYTTKIIQKQYEIYQNILNIFSPYGFRKNVLDVLISACYNVRVNEIILRIFGCFVIFPVPNRFEINLSPASHIPSHSKQILYL